MIEGITKTVNVEREQSEFLNGQGRKFNFSAFVRDKLWEYMKMLDKSVMEEIEIEKTVE